jgi:hypothetical protein
MADEVVRTCAKKHVEVTWTGTEKSKCPVCMWKRRAYSALVLSEHYETRYKFYKTAAIDASQFIAAAGIDAPSATGPAPLPPGSKLLN